MAAAMVDEGVRALRDPDHPVMATIAVAEMARRVGVTERTGYAKWDAEDFHVAIIREALRPLSAPDRWADADALVDQGREVMFSKDIPAAEGVGLIFNVAWKALLDDPNRRVTYALWPYCTGNSRVAQEIRSSLTAYYDGWTKRLLSIVDSFLSRHSRKVSVRADLSREDMAFLAILIAEGAGFHARLSESVDNPRFNPELPGWALQVLLGYAIEFHDDEGPHPLDRHLGRLDD